MHRGSFGGPPDLGQQRPARAQRLLRCRARCHRRIRGTARWAHHTHTHTPLLPSCLTLLEIKYPGQTPGVNSAAGSPEHLERSRAGADPAGAAPTQETPTGPQSAARGAPQNHPRAPNRGLISAATGTGMLMPKSGLDGWSRDKRRT